MPITSRTFQGLSLHPIPNHILFASLLRLLLRFVCLPGVTRDLSDTPTEKKQQAVKTAVTKVENAQAALQKFVADHPAVQVAVIVVAAALGVGEGAEGAAEGAGAEGAAAGGSAESAAGVPGRPYTGANAPEQAYQHLEEYHGVSPEVASERLHQIKQGAGLGATDNVTIGRTGDVYNARTGERIGSLTQSH
jgi:hypothetical protein